MVGCRPIGRPALRFRDVCKSDLKLVPMVNEESKPKNNSQSNTGNSNFIRSEIKLIGTKIQLHIINRWN